MTRRAIVLAAALPLVAAVSSQQPATFTRASETALDRYVATPDPSFRWKVLRELPAQGVTATLLDMTQQGDVATIADNGRP